VLPLPPLSLIAVLEKQPLPAASKAA
jgi:hypothetical protein